MARLRRAVRALLGLVLAGGAAAGCHGNPGSGSETAQVALPANPEPAAAPASQPAQVSEQERRDGYAASQPDRGSDGRTRYGRALVDGTPEVTLAELLAHPTDFAGKTVRTAGSVARVCKAMGCWMELREDGAPERALRAPMAGHAFFLPQDVVGQHATIEGTVKVAKLSEAQKAHYRAEGMRTVDVAASIDAESVVVGGP